MIRQPDEEVLKKIYEDIDPVIAQALARCQAELLVSHMATRKKFAAVQEMLDEYRSSLRR